MLFSTQLVSTNDTTVSAATVTSTKLSAMHRVCEATNVQKTFVAVQTLCIVKSLVLLTVAAATVVLLVLTNWVENNMHGSSMNVFL